MENWYGMYYSREIFKDLKLGINISVPVNSNNNYFYTEYFINKEINFQKYVNLNIRLAYSALNEAIFDYKNYYSGQLILAFGINFKL